MGDAVPQTPWDLSLSFSRMDVFALLQTAPAVQSRGLIGRQGYAGMRPERRFKSGMEGGLTAAVLVSPPLHLRTVEILSKRWGPPHYIAAMFHDMGLTPQYSSKTDRFEVDGANAARAFLRRHDIAQQDIDTVWTAISLHTTPGIPQYMHPVVALLTNGVEMDVLGIAYSEFSGVDREGL
jgi:hypothetical protein